MKGRRKKNRKSRASGARPQAELSLEQLEVQARNLLQAGKHREAIAAFKRLLHQEQRQHWIDALAEAYAGRAHGLAAKGMFKEAAVIWRNRADACHRFLAEPRYIELLFQSGQFEAALQLIQEQFLQIEQRGDLPRLRMLCAAQVLAGQEALLEWFPEDDPLRRDFPAARAALQAYCKGDDAELERQSKTIPFRSPFRDLRQILKALSQLPQDPSSAEALLRRIEAGSPFYPLSTTIRDSQLPNQEFIRRYQDMAAAERRFAAALKGWSAEQLRLSQELYQLDEHPGMDKLLRFLLRNKEALGDGYVRENAMRILISHPRGEAAFNKSLGRLSGFHRQRIAALRLEGEAPPHEIFNAWHDACAVLDQPELRQDPEHALSKALILRRMTRQWLESEPFNPPAAAALEHALGWDPDDQPAYLELIRLYREQRKLKDARRLLDEALARYPGAIEVLTEAVETAIASRAFKKATRIARRVLELDPINPRVPVILLDSHLAHARKQIHQQRFPLARSELEQAARWACTEEGRGRIDLARGVLELSAGDKKVAQGFFLSGFERTGGGLAGRFQLLLEVGRMGGCMGTVMKQARLPKPPRRATREQVLALIHSISESAAEDESILIEAVAFLQRPLQGTATLDYSQTEMERLCETWLRLQQFDLRTRFARAALKRWPDIPVFVFHQIDADHDMSFLLSSTESQQLETAYERARREGDMRTAHRIAELLDASMPFVGPDDAEPVFDPFDFEAGPVGVPDEEILQQMVEMLMQADGPPEIAEMKRVLGMEGTRRLLREIVQGDFDPGGLDAILEGSEKPKAHKKPGKKAVKRNPDQFDLF